MSTANGVEDLMAVFRDETGNVATGLPAVHPLLVASQKFVETEKALEIANARWEAAKKELDESEAEVSQRMAQLANQKSALAELVK
jgi:hypothetical protein